jgi:signal transduction histidine kinase
MEQGAPASPAEPASPAHEPGDSRTTPPGATHGADSPRRDTVDVQKSLELSLAVLGSLVDCMAVLDGDGTIIALNDAWKSCACDVDCPPVVKLGVLGASAPEVFGGAVTAADVEGLRSVLRGSSPTFRSEYSPIDARQDRWYRMEVMPLQRPEGGAVVLHRDITDRRHSDQELRSLRMHIWHAHRVAQLGVIAGSLAHELNQPLAAILSNAQAGQRLMARADTDLDEIREILSDIVYDDKRAASVIVGLRSMLRRRETVRERIDFERTIREVLAMLRSELLSHEIEIEFHAGPDLPLSADRTQIQQVIINLVMNAIEAMNDVPSEQRRIQMAVWGTPEGRALFTIRDRGPGIPEDLQRRVFDAFWTTKPDGMGIGLPISRSIIESHGGQLGFENHPEQGVTFHVSLPLSPGDPPGREEDA